MGYYLIKQWTPHRGQTRENPGCLFYGSMIYRYPLSEKVKPYNCYSSRKRAENAASKLLNIYSKTEIYEIPEELIEK